MYADVYRKQEKNSLFTPPQLSPLTHLAFPGWRVTKGTTSYILPF